MFMCFPKHDFYCFSNTNNVLSLAILFLYIEMKEPKQYKKKSKIQSSRPVIQANVH